MADESNKYTVPFGIDASTFFTDVNKIADATDSLGAQANEAGKQMQNAFNQTAASADKLQNSISADGEAIKILQQQAAKAGNDIANSLTGKGVDTAFSARIDAIKQKLKTLTTITLDLNFDDAKIKVLQDQIKQATTYTEEFNTVIQFAKDQLATMDAGGQNFVTLQNQIKTAEGFVLQLNQVIDQTLPEFEQLRLEFQKTFEGLSGNFNSTQLEALDQEIIDSETDAEALNVQIIALSKHLATLTPGTQLFNDFTEAVNLGDKALNSLGIETEAYSEQTDNATKKTVNFRTELRNIRQEMAQLFAAGQQDSEEFQVLEQRATTVGNAMLNASKSIKQLSSNTIGLEAGTQAVTALGGAFIAAQGAVTLFGDDSKKAQEVTQKLYLALAALQGIQQLSNALQKDSILTLLLFSAAKKLTTVATVEQTVATEAETAAMGENAVATEAEVVATEGATAATEGFTAALLLNPITLIVVAILAAATALIEYASATDESEKAVDRLNLALAYEKDLFSNNVKVIQDVTQQQIAYANARGEKESEITEITIGSLQKELAARNSYVSKLNAHYALIQKQLDAGILSQKDFNTESDKLDQELTQARDAALNTQAQIDLQTINERAQAVKEQVALEAALIQEENSNFAARKSIQNATIAFIKDAHKQEEDELTRDNDKQLQKIKDAAQDRIDVVKNNISDLSEKIKENNKQIGLIGDQAKIGQVDPAVATKQIADLKGQNALISNEIKAGRLDIQAITDSSDVQLLNAQRDFQRKQLDLTLQANSIIAQTLEDGHDKDLAVLKAQYDQQVQQIKEQFKNNAGLQGQLIAYITGQYANAILKTNEDFRQTVIQQDSQLAQLRLQNSGKYALDSTKQQDQLNVQLLQIQLDAAQKSRDGMVDDGKKATQVAIAQADNLILQLKNKLKGATDKANQVDIFDVLGLGKLNDPQKAVLTSTFNDIKAGLKSVTDAQIAATQQQINAKQTLIDSETNDLSTLQSQLDKEKALRDKGLANNVDAIQAQIDAKNVQIDADKAQQDKLIKQRQAAQRLQAELDAATELGNLIVASTNIFKASTAAFGPIGVPIAIIAIAAMTAGFVAAQIKAQQAISQANTASGSFADGGFIEGRKHKQGGQRYRSIDGSGGLLELEDGEFVVKDNVASRHADFLEALNNEQMNESHLLDFLHDMGITLQSDGQNKAKKEIAQNTKAKEQYFTNISADIGSEDLRAIRLHTEYLADRERRRPDRWEDEKFYYEQAPGGQIKKIQK